MGALKNFIEPGAIAILFTLGALINRCSLPSASRSSSPLLGPRRDVSPPAPTAPTWIQRLSPDNTRFQRNFGSRLLRTFPFLFEILYWNLTYWIYQLSRALTAVKISNKKSVFATARSHAVAVLSLEEDFGLAIEKHIQQWLLKNYPWLMNVFATIYYSHIIVSVAFLVYTYTFIRRRAFQKIRRTMAACNLLAFIILSVYRTMPPRMLPKVYGFVDVLHPANEGSSWTHNRFQLTIAAMPSLHFGMSGFIAYCLLCNAPHKALRILAPLWPIAMLTTIIATANHFLLDAIVGALVPLVAWRINSIFLLLRPVEEWSLWIMRTSKPDTADQDPIAFRKSSKDLAEEQRIDSVAEI